MRVLAIDTSNQILSVAIVVDQKIVAEYTTNVSRNHSVRLMPAIETIMQEANMDPKELEKIVVAIGPGSYTGVRIGVTTAKTFGYSLNIPVVPISSLELVAYNGLYFDGYICPFFDARRGQVYTGLYKSDGDNLKLEKAEMNVLMEDFLNEIVQMNKKILFISNDMDIHREKISEIMGNLAIYAPTYLSYPRASLLGVIGEKRKGIDQIHELVPNYLRLVEAEAKWLEHQKRDNSNG
jgi:tRNA threonylcarbamoyladenosine biosynthesis protein TsaB